MKNLKAYLILLTLGIIGTADAQYYYGPPPPPPPPGYRHEREEKKDDSPATPTGYFGVSIGLATPVGGFGSTTGSGYGGYAMPGDNIDISLGVPVNHSNLGVALMYGDYNNAFDINGYVNNIQMSDQSKSYAAITGDYYNESFLLAGLYLTLPVQRFSFDFKFMAGMAFCNLPEVDYGANYNPTYGNYDYEWDDAASRTISFAYGLGADMRYKFRRASLLLGVDYVGSNPMVSSMQTYYDPLGGQTQSRISGSLPISVVSVNIGVAYEIR